MNTSFCIYYGNDATTILDFQWEQQNGIFHRLCIPPPNTMISLFPFNLSARDTTCVISSTIARIVAPSYQASSTLQHSLMRMMTASFFLFENACMRRGGANSIPMGHKKVVIVRLYFSVINTDMCRIKVGSTQCMVRALSLSLSVRTSYLLPR